MSSGKRRDYNRGYAAGLRQAIIIALGGKCSMCDVSDPFMLHIDHVKGGGTQHRKKTGTGPAYYRSLLAGVRAGLYRLLCANHDRKTQYINRIRSRKQID